MISKLLTLLHSNEVYVGENGIDHSAKLGKPVTDHRMIKPGDTFIAIKGNSFDGNQFVKDAIGKGASMIISEEETHHASILVNDSRKAAALAAKVFFENPSSRFKLFGVTGTNGKTTTSLMLFQSFKLLGYFCGWIGTLGYKIDNEDYTTSHTTPDIIQLNEIFHQMAERGVSHVIMEVSSHALALDRVFGIEFDYCMFSNLSRDHLDFHKDMESYFEAKYLLFERAAKANSVSIVNTDDAFGLEIYNRLLRLNAPVVCIGRKKLPQNEEPPTFGISDVQTGLYSSSFCLCREGFDPLFIDSPLIGSFNIENLALALAALIVSERDTSRLHYTVQKLQAIKGRIEPVVNQYGIGVYIDYAHTPDAIANIVKSCHQLPHGRIITLFGAGGDRDVGKRSLMLKAALSYSDAVIVSDDNPRYENPESIIFDIVKDTDHALPWWIIRDRKKAIISAIRLARSGDIVLICGKGHETYQEILGVRHDFNDHEVAIHAFNELSHQKDEDELILPIDRLMLTILEDRQPRGEGYVQPECYHRVSTDSRTIQPQSVYFALKGDRFDGHDFIGEALKHNSVLAIGDKSEIDFLNYICVDCSLSLYSRLMRKYLQMFDVYKIAITGSTGKTSTKELIACILANKAPTLKTNQNENNIIGVCKTILRIKPADRYAVFEIGTNHFGEISNMANTITPDAGLILNVGPSHLEEFGDEAGVFKEKADLFRRALALRIFSADDPRFDEFIDEGVSVGYSDRADFKITGFRKTDTGQSFRVGGYEWLIPYNANHYVVNSAFAIALSLKIGIDAICIQESLRAPILIENRMQVFESRTNRGFASEKQVGGILVISDCYNANPVSMQSALEYWRDLDPEKPHIAILGDMLELGESSEMYHCMIGAMLGEMEYSGLFTVGNYSRFYNPQQGKHKHFDSSIEMLQDFPDLPVNSVVLLKASHGIKLEILLPKLRGDE